MCLQNTKRNRFYFFLRASNQHAPVPRVLKKCHFNSLFIIYRIHHITKVINIYMLSSITWQEYYWSYLECGLSARHNMIMKRQNAQRGYSSYSCLFLWLQKDFESTFHLRNTSRDSIMCQCVFSSLVRLLSLYVIFAVIKYRINVKYSIMNPMKV